MGLNVHVHVSHPATCLSQLLLRAVTAWLLLPLCLSPPILFTAPFPPVSTDRSTKCFPSLPAIFIPFIRVISFVNSFLAQRRQPHSVPASAVGTGRVWAPITGGKSGWPWRLLVPWRRQQGDAHSFHFYCWDYLSRRRVHRPRKHTISDRRPK